MVILEQKKFNTIIYNIAIIETNHFLKSYYKQLNKQIAEIYINIKTKKIKFNKKVTQYLRIWLKSQLKFNTHMNKNL